MSAYNVIIAACVIILLSFLFNNFSKRTNFPSVLLLIMLGVGGKLAMDRFGVEFDFFPLLEVLGIIGLILIVLEAALDLELKKEKRKLIFKSMIIGLLGLVINALIIGAIFRVTIPNIDYLIGLIYAIPLSIISSAIVIPSISNLSKDKREFMIYESTFSDIFGIMFFYYLLENVNAQSLGAVSLSIGLNILVTIVVALLLSYALVYLLQTLNTNTKFFVLLAILILLYSLGKLMHISSLILILVFGLVLNNRALFFRGPFKRMGKNRCDNNLIGDFKGFTAELAFVVRTFFFVIFGITLSLDSLIGIDVWVISIIILVVIYGFRLLLFRGLKGKDTKTEVLIAPRGLISVLLFFAIPEAYKVKEFESGVLFVIIIVTSLMMAFSLIRSKRKSAEELTSGEELDKLINE